VTTDEWGIDDGWSDTGDRWHPAPPETLEAIRAAMTASVRTEPRQAGLDAHRTRDLAAGGPETRRYERNGSSTAGFDGAASQRGVLVVRPGAPEHLAGRCQVELEDGTDLGELDELPPHLPLGLHWLRPVDGSPDTTLIVSPGRCHLPPDLRAWGAAMQVPTTRSAAGWGIGDLADVRTVAAWLADQGATVLGLSPLHAPTPVLPISRSPYYPSSRRWKSPLLLRIDEVPGAANSPEVRALGDQARGNRSRSEPLEAIGAACGTHRLETAATGPIASRGLVDRDRVWALQREALQILWRGRSDRTSDALARWREEQGPALETWARYCALAEVHGPRWSQWPAELRHPDSPAVAEAVAPLADEVAFHAWLQQLVEQQLAAANVGDVRLIQDLAIGVDPDGADAWSLQDLLALDMNVGAPPDDFAPDGQGWGLPPFVPWRLRDAGYRPLAELLRASMAPGGGLRVDHVMGLSRLFWIPNGASPADGTYVRFAGRELLDVVALESARAEAIVVGEDLGTVEPAFREELQHTAVLSTRLVWFEDDPPASYPHEALAMVTTHDLPTIAGVWTGADDDELEALGRSAPVESRAEVTRRLDARIDLPRSAPVGEVVDAVHRALSASPAAVTLATLEDLCEVEQRPNVPGTTDDERPNWSIPLPKTVEELVDDATVSAHLGALRPPD
jgi:4-alpha-glucanotransferase